MTDEHATATKKKLEDERAAREKVAQAHAKAASETKPTPTQIENDMAASGVYLAEHEADGSPPDPNATDPQHKAMESSKSGGYQTRAATPKA